MKTIDVTLRESVYCLNKINIENALLIIDRLCDLNMDLLEYIEIGYLKSNNDSYLLNYSPSYISEAYDISNGRIKLCVMIHPEDFENHRAWDRKILKKLSLVRICVNEKNIKHTQDIINYFHDIGLKVSLNLTHISKYSFEQCQELASCAADMGADYFYIADSNGNLLPDELKGYIRVIKSNANNMKVGFHAHDNLGMAQVNALTSLEEGADILDTSILGYGKGGGNLRTEFFPLLLIKRNLLSYRSLDFNKLLDLGMFLHKHVSHCQNIEEQFRYAIYGAYDLNYEIAKQLVSLSKKGNTDIMNLTLHYIKECENNLIKQQLIN